MDRDVVVLGGANADYLVRGERLPGRGETVQGEEFDEAPGGKGANQAVAAARLGASVAMIGRVGADARGDLLVGRLEREGVDARHVGRDADVGLTGIEVRDFATARRAAEALLGRGAGAAIVEAGDEGNLVLTGEGTWRFPRFDVDRVDATGAGDAFAAAVAVGLARGLSWPDIGALASAAAALKTKKLGAQAGLPKWAEVEAFLGERGVGLGGNAPGGR